MGKDDVQDCDRELEPNEQCSSCGDGIPGMEVEYVCAEHCEACCPDNHNNCTVGCVAPGPGRG